MARGRQKPASFFMSDFLDQLRPLVERYLSVDAEPGEFLPLLSWQIEAGHALESRETYPGHVTASAIILAPHGRETLLVDHITLKRWLQPGGHYEPAQAFWHSAKREAVEETGLQALALHTWHQGQDRPFMIDSHVVPGKTSRGERPHYHHDLQYLFVADADQGILAQLDEVTAAQWHPVEALEAVTPRGFARMKRLGLINPSGYSGR
jgi:8-oxo-dGTP pyrophosphatase MutT (NUDIX family)